MTRWLNAREWLEHERLTGLPHADFAAEVLADMHRLDDLDEDDSRGQAESDLEGIENHVQDCVGKSTVDRVEWAVAQLEQLLDLTNGGLETVVVDIERADLRFWAIWDVLIDAGLVERNDQVDEVDIPGLLGMFLPC